MFTLRSDNTNGRALGAATFTDTKNMTVENCISFCDKQSFIFAGVGLYCSQLHDFLSFADVLRASEFAQECCMCRHLITI
jgi:hypothetical protein